MLKKRGLPLWQTAPFPRRQVRPSSIRCCAIRCASVIKVCVSLLLGVNGFHRIKTACLPCRRCRTENVENKACTEGIDEDLRTDEHRQGWTRARIVKTVVEEGEDYGEDEADESADQRDDEAFGNDVGDDALACAAECPLYADLIDSPAQAAVEHAAEVDGRDDEQDDVDDEADGSCHAGSKFILECI